MVPDVENQNKRKTRTGDWTFIASLFFCVIVWDRNGGRPRETGDGSEGHPRALTFDESFDSRPEVPASNVSGDGNVDTDQRVGGLGARTLRSLFTDI